MRALRPSAPFTPPDSLWDAIQAIDSLVAQICERGEKSRSCVMSEIGYKVVAHRNLLLPSFSFPLAPRKKNVGRAGTRRSSRALYPPY